MSGLARSVAARAWMDEDGRHIWASHECAGGKISTHILPPGWYVADDAVRPSFICLVPGCDVHANLTLGKVDG